MVVRACREQGIICRIRTSPDLLDNVVRELALEHGVNLVDCDEIKSVSMLKVLLEEEIAHLELRLDPVHVLLNDLLDLVAEGLTPDSHLVKLGTDLLEQLYQETGGLDDVEV